MAGRVAGMFTITCNTTRFRPAAALAALGVAALVSPSSAALLVDPSGGIVTASATTGPMDKDNGTYQAVYGPFGSFFGGSLPSQMPTITLNGHFFYGPDISQGDHLPQGLSLTDMVRISPLWLDLQLGTNGRVIESLGDSYYAVTWENMESKVTAGTYATFQAIFFEFDDTMHGIDFKAGDIAFAYGDLGAYQVANEVIVGIESFSDFAAIPGTEAQFGWNSYPVTGNFPVGTVQYLHFRPDGDGNYVSSIEPIPEASVAFLGGLGALMLLRRKRDRVS